jgi:plasmid stabilization system protein ParE
VTYRVIITSHAEEDLRLAYRYIRKSAPQAAREWIKGARQKIKSLAKLPERVPLAPESESFEEPIRELLYGRGNRGTYRILFVILAKTVFVLHVRHGSMQTLELEE